MSTRVEGVASVVRAAVETVAPQIVDPHTFGEVFAPRLGGLGFVVADAEIRERAARGLVSEWLVGYAVSALAGSASLADAERWFYGGLTLPSLARGVECRLGELPESGEVFALLPYILDSLRPGTRREVLRDRDALADRRVRKARGAYYTPADVACFMTRAVGVGPSDTCLDTSCGTGVFLREAMLVGSAASHSVYGCDIDPAAVEAAAFVVASTSLWRGDGNLPAWSLWHLARLNLVALDSLRLDVAPSLGSGRAKSVGAIRNILASGGTPHAASEHAVDVRLGEIFPALAVGADVLLSNPPYAPLGRAAEDLADAGFGSVGHGTRAEALFAEYLWRATKKKTGRGAIVLPLSAASSSKAEFIALRTKMQRQSGSWEISLFDRAPDALFGDDVKTRNAVFTYRAGDEPSIRTTRLLRWTSRNRRAFLASISCTPISVDITDRIPKIGSRREAELYENLRARPTPLSCSLALTWSAEEHGSATVLVAPTAYNWISVVRDGPRLARDGHTSRNALIRLAFQSDELADAAYALLSSRLVLWLWQVEGDGFHVTRTFIENLPFDLAACGGLPTFAAFGQRLWRIASARPIRSINKGQTTVAYPTAELALLDELDAFVISAFGLADSASVGDVRRWHENLVVVDLGEQKRLRRLTGGKNRA